MRKKTHSNEKSIWKTCYRTPIFRRCKNCYYQSLALSLRIEQKELLVHTVEVAMKIEKISLRAIWVILLSGLHQVHSAIVFGVTSETRLQG